MMYMKKAFIVSVGMLLVAGLFLQAPPVLAAIQSLTGQAGVMNTGGAVHFTNYESNVSVDTQTGVMSGYAWLDDLGWVAFGTEEGNTEGPVSVSLTDGAVSGKAYCANTGSYIDFDSFNSNVRMDLVTGAFSGHAWSTDLGWVDFADPGVTGPSLVYIVIDNTLSTQEGVASNIGELPDPACAQGLYFEKVGYGKITFGACIDLTKPTVISWLQQLGMKLDLAVRNKIALDADTVQGLIDTQATLTMYNVELENPQILVNGGADISGIVSNMVYDREAKTLTFTAAHFTTFTAVENTGGDKAPVSEIRGRLFCDVNGNASWDAETESPLKGITVLITETSSGTTHSRETDDTGTYVFGTPGNGKYRVMIDSADTDNTCGTSITTQERGGYQVQFVDSLSQQIIYAKDVGLTKKTSSSTSSLPGMPRTGRRG